MSQFHMIFRQGGELQMSPTAHYKGHQGKPLHFPKPVHYLTRKMMLNLSNNEIGISIFLKRQIEKKNKTSKSYQRL